METRNAHAGFFRLALAGFVAGFLATLTFHQITLWVMWRTGFAPFGPYVMHAVPPFGVPAVISLAFWGGVWGIALAWTLDGIRRGTSYWISAFILGAVFPSLVALVVVLPLKGGPMGGGWHWQVLVRAFLINGAWGLGTAFFSRLFLSWHKRSDRAAPECLPGSLCDG